MSNVSSLEFHSYPVGSLPSDAQTANRSLLPRSFHCRLQDGIHIHRLIGVRPGPGPRLRPCPCQPRLGQRIGSRPTDGLVFVDQVYEAAGVLGEGEEMEEEEKEGEGEEEGVGGEVGAGGDEVVMVEKMGKV